VDSKFEDWAHRLHSLIDDAQAEELYRPNFLSAYADKPGAHYLMQTLVSTFSVFLESEEEYTRSSQQSSSPPLTLSDCECHYESDYEESEREHTEPDEDGELLSDIEREMGVFERSALLIHEAGVDLSLANIMNDVTEIKTNQEFNSRVLHLIQQSAEKSLKALIMVKFRKEGMHQDLHGHHLSDISILLRGHGDLKKLGSDLECLGNQPIYDCNNDEKVTSLSVRCRYPSYNFSYAETLPSSVFSTVDVSDCSEIAEKILYSCANLMDNFFAEFHNKFFYFLKFDSPKLFEKMLAVEKMYN